MTLTTLIVFVVCAGWIGGAYWFYSRKPKLIPMVIGSGAVKGDNEVLVMPKPIVVNVIYHSSEEVIDTSAIADVVVNYRDLVSGKYNFSGATAKAGGDEVFKSKSFHYEKKSGEEEKSFSHDDESPVTPYSTGPGPSKEGDQEDDQDETDEEISGSPEFIPAPDESDIPEFDETEDSLTSNAIMDMNKLNLNI